MIDSVFRTGKNYYSQVLLEECKYVVEVKKMPEYIIDKIGISSDSDREDSDEGNSNEENCHEENSDEENLKSTHITHIKKQPDIFDNFFLHIKMVNKNTKKDKERLQKEARERYQNVSEEEKDKRQKKIRERYSNFTKKRKRRKASVLSGT